MRTFVNIKLYKTVVKTSLHFKISDGFCQESYISTYEYLKSRASFVKRHVSNIAHVHTQSYVLASPPGSKGEEKMMYWQPLRPRTAPHRPRPIPVAGRDERGWQHGRQPSGSQSCWKRYTKIEFKFMKTERVSRQQPTSYTTLAAGVAVQSQSGSSSTRSLSFDTFP